MTYKPPLPPRYKQCPHCYNYNRSDGTICQACSKSLDGAKIVEKKNNGMRSKAAAIAKWNVMQSEEATA